MSDENSTPQGVDIVEYWDARLKLVNASQRIEELETAVREIGNVYLAIPDDTKSPDVLWQALGRIMGIAKKALLKEPQEPRVTIDGVRYKKLTPDGWVDILPDNPDLSSWSDDQEPRS